MPNWAMGTVSIEASSKENLIEFMKLFLWDDISYTRGDKHFARSFTNSCLSDSINEIMNINDGQIHFVSFDVDFAWSAYSCLVESILGYPDGITAMFLSDMCKEYGVHVIISTEEPGIGFMEKIVCTADGTLTEESYDMPRKVCPQCKVEYLEYDFEDFDTCLYCREGLNDNSDG